MDYEKAAKLVLQIVQKHLIHGAVNQVTANRQKTLAAYSAAYSHAGPARKKWLRTSPVPSYSLEYWAQMAEGTWEHKGGGRCGAQSHIAAFLLAAYGAFPVEIMALTYGAPGHSAGHAFAVTGRLLSSSLQHPETWGPNAFICDPWQGFVYPAKFFDSCVYCGDDAEPGLSYSSGDPASKCSDESRIQTLSVELQIKDENHLPSGVLEKWQKRLETVTN